MVLVPIAAQFFLPGLEGLPVWPCGMPCRIFVPDQGSNLHAPEVEGWSLNPWTTRKVPKLLS